MQIPKHIIDGCIQNQRQAQQQLHQLTYSHFMCVCVRYVKNQEDAAAILNTAFLKIFTKLDTYTHQQKFEAWMHTIVVNSTLDFLKSQKKYKLHDDIDTLSKEPSNSANGNDLHTKDLLKLLQTLPAIQQTVFNLFAIEGYSHAEIAKQLNISEANSKWHLFNARKTLQEKVNKYYHAH